MPDMERRYQQLVAEMQKEFPGFRIVRKDESPLQRFIAGALAVVTLGSQTRYLTAYQTTIGKTIYVTPGFHDLPAAQRYITLRHERVHLRQFRRYTLPGMALLYLLVPLPLGLAWFRARFEMEGYAETIRAASEVHGLDYVRSQAHRDYVIAQFVSGAYGWMWPFRTQLERWYDGVVADIVREKEMN